MKIRKKQIELKRANGKFPRLLLVLDDCSGVIKESKIFANFLIAHRHFEISIFFVVQYATDLSPRYRELANYAIVFNQTTEKSLKAVYETYFRDFDNLRQFIRWFQNSLKEKYTFFFVDRGERTKNVMKCPNM